MKGTVLFGCQANMKETEFIPTITITNVSMGKSITFVADSHCKSLEDCIELSKHFYQILTTMRDENMRKITENFSVGTRKGDDGIVH